MSLSLVAAVTNNHKPGGLKEQKFNSPKEGLGLEVGNQFHWVEIKVSAGSLSLPGSRGESISCHFQFLGLRALPGLWPHHPNFCLFLCRIESPPASLSYRG